MDARERALLAAHAAEEHKAEAVAVLDVRGQTLVADYFVICTGETAVQIRAITEAVEEAMRAAGARLRHREGTEHARWVLLDYGDVVVHIFGPEERKYYRLERLWGEARVVRFGVPSSGTRALR